MKYPFLLFFFCIIGLAKRTLAQEIYLQIIDSTTSGPIENVYLYDLKKNVVSITDINGKCIINKDLGIVNISHIGYISKTINLLDSDITNIKIKLNPKVYEILEVSVAIPDAKNILQTAINRIDSNYNSLLNDTIGFYTKFSFFDSPQNKIADFDGVIAITKNGDDYAGAKYSLTKDYIDESFFDYSNELSPCGFYNIISIRKHSPIRLNKKFVYNYEGNVIFRKQDVYKVAFNRNGKYSKVNGYMFINKNDYAIVYIYYELGKIDKWIAATSKGKGIVFSNLEKCRIEVEYEKHKNGYILSDGSINMKFNRTNKNRNYLKTHTRFP